MAIAASFVQVGYFWFRHHRVETMHVVTLAVIAVFGGLTLLLHDDTFIKWKPTLVYWILGALVLASQWFGRKTIVERMMSAQIALPAQVWTRLNLSWGIFFAALGAVNLYVAFYYGLDLDAETRQGIWVNFKVFGLLGITLRVSYHVFYQASFLHLEERYVNNRVTEEVTRDDLAGDLLALSLQRVFLFIYGWQDRLMLRIDSWCRKGPPSGPRDEFRR